jgi:tetratricopeptide (TPR) repeat protein
VADALYHLGRVCERLGRYTDAEKHLLESIQTNRVVNGDGHYYEACTLKVLCTTYGSTGRYKEAHKAAKKAIRIFTNTGHIRGREQIAGTLQTRGGICMEETQYEKAAQLFSECVVIFEDMYGKEYTEVLVARGNMVTCYHMLGEIDDAFNLQMELTGIFRQIHVSLDPTMILECTLAEVNVATSLMCLSDLYSARVEFVEALETLQEALPIARRYHGEKHPMVASILYKIGVVYQKQGKLDQASKVQKRALKYRLRALGDGHRLVASSINAIAAIRMDQGEILEAVALCEQARGIYQRTLGSDCEAMGCTHWNIAEGKGQLGHWDEALVSAREAYRIFSTLGTRCAGRLEAIQPLLQCLEDRARAAIPR